MHGTTNIKFYTELSRCWVVEHIIIFWSDFFLKMLEMTVFNLPSLLQFIVKSTVTVASFISNEKHLR